MTGFAAGELLTQARALARTLPATVKRAELAGGGWLREGTVDALNSDGTADVAFGGSSVVTAGCPVLAGGFLATGDSVWALHRPPMPPLILGRLAASGGLAQRGVLTVTVPAGARTAAGSITFDPPFDTSPVVTLTPLHTTTTNFLRAYLNAVDEDSATVRVVFDTSVGSNTDVAVHWQAEPAA